MPVKPRLLDLFCGAGGASMGYHRAGFEVVGIDIAPQPHYPFAFVQADALDALICWWTTVDDIGPFDAIHASPPCQAYAEAAASRKRADHPDLIGPVRTLLETIELPWIIENIPTAAKEMRNPLLLCGATFNLPIIRHRLFETNWPILGTNTCRARKSQRITDHGPGFAPYASGSWEPRWRSEVLPVVWPWMNLPESGQATPPVYTEFIGRQLMITCPVSGTS